MMGKFALRFALTFALVAATWNPWLSFTHWVLDHDWEITPPKAFVFVLLTIGWVYVFTSAWRSLGVIGTGLLGALVGTGLWWALSSLGTAIGSQALTVLVLVSIAAVLALAMSWRDIRRSLGRGEPARAQS
ncbi:MAG TPA: DUF6524 family protein [Myxococcota bacterium]|jgi:hypothetical protein|nr:DUF6524 family protein [Myxococcota bacterium]